MESALDFQSNMIIVPRGFAYVGCKAEKTPGLAWNSKYVFVRAECLRHALHLRRPE